MPGGVRILIYGQIDLNKEIGKTLALRKKIELTFATSAAVRARRVVEEKLMQYPLPSHIIIDPMEKNGIKIENFVHILFAFKKILGENNTLK